RRSLRTRTTRNWAGSFPFDDARHLEQARFLLGGVRHRLVSRKGPERLVLTERGILRAAKSNLGHGFYLGGVQLVQLVDVLQDRVQLRQKLPDLFFGEFEVRKLRHVPDVFLSQRHSCGPLSQRLLAPREKYLAYERSTILAISGSSLASPS